jgi:hypothetical protein
VAYQAQQSVFGGKAKLPAVRLHRQDIAANYARDDKTGAGQRQHSVEASGLVQVADIQLTGHGEEFQISLAMRAMRGNDTQFGVDQFFAGIEEFQCGEVGAAERAARFAVSCHVGSEPVGLEEPVLDHLYVALGQIGEAALHVFDDNRRNGVRYGLGGEHVEEPGHRIAGLAVEAL